MSGDNGGWPDMEQLTSDEGRIVRKALGSLGGQQLEILGSIEGIRQKVDGIESQVSEAVSGVTDIRAEQRSEFKGVRQQLSASHRAIESLNERIGVVGETANQTRETVDSVRKLLKDLQLSDRFVSSPPPSGAEMPSIPPPRMSLGVQTPMGGIKLDPKDQAMLAQRMAKLEEERRIADAVAKERADIIATQKREAEEKRLADEKRQADEKETKRVNDELALKKSQERRAWLAAIVAACLAAGGGLHWLVQTLTHH
jgi:hypothetical protein